MSLLIITPVPDISWIKRLEASAKKHGLRVLPYSMDRPMGSPHCGDIQYTYAVELMRALSEDYIMALDGPDTMVLADEDEIMEKFRSFNDPFVISAEGNNILNTCGITEALSAYPGRYFFPNGGAWIGEREHAIALLDKSAELYRHKPIDPTLDLDAPQAWLTIALFQHTIDFALDRNAALFQSTMGWAGSDVEILNGRMHNRVTDTWPVVAHYNGQKHDLSNFYNHFEAIYGSI